PSPLLASVTIFFFIFILPRPPRSTLFPTRRSSDLKGAILKELDSLPRDTYLELDLMKTRYLDNDVIEILEDFAHKAKERNIDIKLVSKRGVEENPESFIEFFRTRPKSSISLS